MAEPRTLQQRITDTRAQLADAIDAWVASTSSERPWLAPLSTLWHDEHLIMATDASSPTIRNAQEIPRLRIGLGGTRDVVIVEGDAFISPSSELTDEELRLYDAKHHSDPRTWADSIIRLRPHKIMAWREENELQGRVIMKNGAWLN